MLRGVKLVKTCPKKKGRRGGVFFNVRMRLKNCQAGIMNSLRMLPVVPDLARPPEPTERFELVV